MRIAGIGRNRPDQAEIGTAGSGWQSKAGSGWQAVRDRPMERQMGNVHDRGCAGLWNGNKE